MHRVGRGSRALPSRTHYIGGRLGASSISSAWRTLPSSPPLGAIDLKDARRLSGAPGAKASTKKSTDGEQRTRTVWEVRRAQRLLVYSRAGLIRRLAQS